MFVFPGPFAMAELPGKMDKDKSDGTTATRTNKPVGWPLHSLPDWLDDDVAKLKGGEVGIVGTADWLDVNLDV